jgi:uncharacterized membrane protein YdjX (TVP38/TMEM64 family)
VRYLPRESRRRLRQAIPVALGLALVVGLIFTVAAAFAQVKKAEADQVLGPGGTAGPAVRGIAPHVVAVSLHPDITVGAIILAVAGSLLAGSAGSSHIVRLRPPDTLIRVA